MGEVVLKTLKDVKPFSKKSLCEEARRHASFYLELSKKELSDPEKRINGYVNQGISFWIGKFFNLNEED